MTWPNGTQTKAVSGCVGGCDT